MPTTSSPQSAGSILLVGASRGLGLGMATEFLGRGWSVVGTVRGGQTLLHGLLGDYGDRLQIEQVDITEADEIAALHDRLENQLAGRRFDMLFVNAGVAGANAGEALGALSTGEFNRVMETNVLGPMRVIERLQGLVAESGLMGVMSSGQGSLASNTRGGHELYRASKAALNMAMRSYAARQAASPPASQPASSRALVLLAPGWIRTALGGPDAPFTIEESVPKLVDVLLAQRGKPGLHYIDRDGRTVPW